MKELSIEQKAKAYDELLAKAKQIYNKENDVLIMHTIEDLFPELKESEDEKVRKEILDCFRTMKRQGCFPSEHKEQYNLWIAWLEEQGEQKPYGQREECLDCQVNYAGECKGSCAMKRDEQKPTDETPYPETLEKAINLYYYSYGNGEGEFEHLSLEKFRDIVHTFVSDYGQKPAWSEEDEDMLGDIIEDVMILHRGNTLSVIRNKVNWLKSIKQRIRGE